MARAAQDLTPPELAVEVSGLLRAAGIEHAVGGALALGFYAEPRGTLDVDLNVFVDADDPGEALDTLSAGGVALDRGQAIAAIASRGDLFLRHRGCRLDLFFNSIPFHASVSRRTREVRLLGARVPILAPEDLIVLKLLFHRHKDIVDIEHIVATGETALDWPYVRHWLIECVGEDDARMATLNTVQGDQAGHHPT